jgi:hypothetical protein
VLLRVLCRLVGYRFHDYLSPMCLPYRQDELSPEEVRNKARASAGVVGIFLAFVVGLIAAFVAIAAEHPEVSGALLPRNPSQVFGIVAGTVLPYLILWSERKIGAASHEAKAYCQRIAKLAKSAAAANPGAAIAQPADGEMAGEANEVSNEEIRQEKARRRDLYVTVQVCLILFSFSLLITCTSRELLAHALAPAGLVLVFCSLLLLVLSVEFYDTAGGWLRLQDAPYHFHMASVASHCYLMGLPLALIGSSLLLCLPFPIMGFVVTAITLAVLVAMTKIERELFDLSQQSSAPSL